MGERARIAIVNGSLSESSAGTRLGEQLVAALEDRRPPGDHAPEVLWVNLQPLGRELLDSLHTGVLGATLEQAYQTVAEADLLVAITPTFQASYAGLFKMFWDLLPEDSVRGKLTLLAATGGTGRHSLMVDSALRPLFAYLGALSLPTGLFAATQDWGAPGFETEVGLEEPLERRIDRAAREAWAFLDMPGRGTPDKVRSLEEEPGLEPDSATKAFPGFVDFETLLGEVEG